MKSSIKKRSRSNFNLNLIRWQVRQRELTTESLLNYLNQFYSSNLRKTETGTVRRSAKNVYEAIRVLLLEFRIVRTVSVLTWTAVHSTELLILVEEEIAAKRLRSFPQSDAHFRAGHFPMKRHTLWLRFARANFNRQNGQIGLIVWWNTLILFPFQFPELGLFLLILDSGCWTGDRNWTGCKNLGEPETVSPATSMMLEEHLQMLLQFCTSAGTGGDGFS